jgi:hypothetical protein
VVRKDQNKDPIHSVVANTVCETKVLLPSRIVTVHGVGYRLCVHGRLVGRRGPRLPRETRHWADTAARTLLFVGSPYVRDDGGDVSRSVTNSSVATARADSKRDRDCVRPIGFRSTAARPRR